MKDDSISQDPKNPVDHHDQFVLLLLKHRHQIVAFIAKQLVNSSDVEDVFQKTSLVLWKKMEQYDDNFSFLSWACGIAFNEVRNQIRIKGREKLYFDADLIELLAAEAEAENELSLLRREALNTCIDRLPAGQQNLVRQCYLDSKSISDVAEFHGLSRGAMYKQLSRIREKLLLCIRKRVGKGGEFA